MSDATPVVEEKLRELLAARSPTERVRMTSRMFATAKALAIAGLRSSDPALSERDLRHGLLLRLYGDELSERDRVAIAAQADPQERRPDT